MAAPGPAVRDADTGPAKPLEELIRDLSDERFKVRESATHTIWRMGESALPELSAVAEGKDPEAAYRAREMVRKIELHITPDTDPEVIRLVERYTKASVDEKQDLLGAMVRKRAWRQILGLFADEQNPLLVKRFQGAIDAVAVTAARESLLAGKPDEAREYLEMAPADAAGLMALAEFHRSQGTLDAEVARAKTLDGEAADAWLLALYRASGNLEAARAAADAAGEPAISAILSMMMGDPVPWLRWSMEHREIGRGNTTYSALAIERWLGNPPGPVELKPLLRGLDMRAQLSRMNAIDALYLLGEVKPAEEAYIKNSAIDGFGHLESLERIPEALAVLGLDPENPDYSAWVAKRFQGLENGEDDPEQMRQTEATELLIMANFMDRRGMVAEFSKSFVKPLEEMARKDEKEFLEFLTRMFGANMRFDGAPDLVRRVGYDWAGDDESRWGDLLRAAFGENEQVDNVWEWLVELDPGASRIDRFDAILALADMGTDPMRLRDRWLELGWKEVESVPETRRNDVLEKLAHAIDLKPDVANNLKLWDTWQGEGRDRFFRDNRISELTIAGRWDEAADFFLEQLSLVVKFKQSPSPAMHASAAACLRKAGRLDEAAEQDQWVEQLFLGNGAYQIAVAYQFGDDFERSARWIARAVLEDKPDPTGEYSRSLLQHGTNLLEAGKWKEAAAALEVTAQMATESDELAPMVSRKLTLRLEADLAHALSILGTDRAAALAMLERAYAMSPGDGALADHFFPSLRQVGLIEEHDKWFKISWDRLSAVADRYPGSSNTLNTVGWLGAKAHRNLDAARDYEQQALALKPDQYTYLDTMAEIEFAAGNRAKAVEWSERAVNFTPVGYRDDGYGTASESFLLRRQREHFRNDALPR